MSTIDIDYDSVAPTADHVGGGVGDALAASASAFVIGLGALLRLLIYVAPWGVLGALGFWSWRRLRRRFTRAAPSGPPLETPPS